MKCLLCDFKSQNEAKLMPHYIFYHRIEPNNYFFKALFNTKNAYWAKDCTCCGEFLITKEVKNVHNFLKHYELGNEEPIDEKPIRVINRGQMTIYQLNYSEHHNYYNFYDAEHVVDDLIQQVRYRHKPTEPYQFKADFAIENKQNAPEGAENTAAIKTLRCWSTGLYSGVHFNSFIAAGIRSDILRRVINTGLSGSSWHFNRFSHLNLKALKKLHIIYRVKMAEFIDFEAEASDLSAGEEELDDAELDDPMIIDDQEDLPINDCSLFSFCNQVNDPAEILASVNEE